jgi:spermidine/putrescine transport system ATP-binding protein
VSLEIRTGEFFSLLGPSGCGKTTTLRMIGGFELPTAGRIELRGRDITTDPPDKRPVNMVFQNYALFPHLDVAGNVAFGLRRKGVGGPDTRRRVGEALELVHLSGYDKRKPNQLSGGQQQRVALARALVNRPNVLLLDEPLGALDLKLRKALQIELKRVQMEVGITFVYVTHDQEEALTMSDRIAVMNRGRVEQLGSPEELYERPRTRFVAPDVRVGRRVELSIRPESVALDRRNRSGPSDGVGAISASVEQVAYLGGNVQYLVRSGGGLSITALASKAGDRIPVGGAVDVTWSPGDALVLAEHPVAQEEIPA